LYALKNNLSLEEATEKIIAEYEKVGDGSLKWYDIKYWFEFFKLPGHWNDLLQKYRKEVRLFPEVKEVIEVLSKNFKLIVTSNAAREFVEIEIKETGIEPYFFRIFSATSDFGQVKKTPQFYQQVCEIIEVNPFQMVHVGDHYEFDFLAPQKLGIKTYHLDRNGNRPEDDFTIKNLKKLIHLLYTNPDKK
jgi:putative hydrolase of the HAD superfamily